MAAAAALVKEKLCQHQQNSAWEGPFDSSFFALSAKNSVLFSCRAASAGWRHNHSPEGCC